MQRTRTQGTIPCPHSAEKLHQHHFSDLLLGGIPQQTLPKPGWKGNLAAQDQSGVLEQWDGLLSTSVGLWRGEVPSLKRETPAR